MHQVFLMWRSFQVQDLVESYSLSCVIPVLQFLRCATRETGACAPGSKPWPDLLLEPSQGGGGSGGVAGVGTDPG